MAKSEDDKLEALCLDTLAALEKVHTLFLGPNNVLFKYFSEDIQNSIVIELSSKLVSLPIINFPNDNWATYSLLEKWSSICSLVEHNYRQPLMFLAANISIASKIAIIKAVDNCLTDNFGALKDYVEETFENTGGVDNENDDDDEEEDDEDNTVENDKTESHVN